MARYYDAAGPGPEDKGRKFALTPSYVVSHGVYLAVVEGASLTGLHLTDRQALDLARQLDALVGQPHAEITGEDFTQQVDVA